jgi:hypothetical protein
MAVPKTAALPLGDTPTTFACFGPFCKNSNTMPVLNILQRKEVAIKGV